MKLFSTKPKVVTVPETRFSAFIRNASAAEKKKVYSEVMRKAIESQNKLIQMQQATRSK